MITEIITIIIKSIVSSLRSEYKKKYNKNMVIEVSILSLQKTKVINNIFSETVSTTKNCPI